MIGALCAGVALDEIGRGTSIRVTLRGAVLLATTDAPEPVKLHEPGYALVIADKTFVSELSVDARLAVGRSAEGVDLPDPVEECRVGDVAGGGPPAQPGVVAAGGETQHAAHCGYRRLGLMSLHQLEPDSGMEPL
jgi:hypothetical protein